MKVLDDIWASIKGNAKTRINDPIIGAFVISWGLCNWDRLALLFWGTGKLEERISMFSQEVSFLNEPSLLWTNYGLLILPLIFFLCFDSTSAAPSNMAVWASCPQACIIPSLIDL